MDNKTKKFENKFGSIVFFFLIYLYPKLKIMKKLKMVFFVLLLSGASLIVYAKSFGTEVNDCDTGTIFWGTSCCNTTQVITNPYTGQQVTEGAVKCCKYRFFFVVPNSCTFTGTGEVVSDINW